MRFFNSPHQFYCGVDLHAKTLPRCAVAIPITEEPRPHQRQLPNPNQSHEAKSLSQKGSDPLEASRSFDLFTRLAGEGQTPFGIGYKSSRTGTWPAVEPTHFRDL